MRQMHKADAAGPLPHRCRSRCAPTTALQGGFNAFYRVFDNRLNPKGERHSRPGASAELLS